MWGLSFYYNKSNEISNMIIRFSAIVYLFILFRRIKQSKIQSFLNFIGKYTLSIYLLHSLLIRGTNEKLLEINEEISSFFMLIIYLAMAIIVSFTCIFLYKIFITNKYLGYIMFGTKK